MKRVYVIHGYTGHPDKNWFPWLKNELENLGIAVTVPEMPDTNSPTFHTWLDYLHRVIQDPDENTYLVGHSLGCPTILRYLESLDESIQVGGAILVAGFAEPLPHLPQLDSFTIGKWNDSYIRNRTKQLSIINSDDDQAVPFMNGEHIRDRFNAKLVTVYGAGHINEKSGYTQVSFVLEELKSMMGI